MTDAEGRRRRQSQQKNATKFDTTKLQADWQQVESHYQIEQVWQARIGHLLIELKSKSLCMDKRRVDDNEDFSAFNRPHIHTHTHTLKNASN